MHTNVRESGTHRTFVVEDFADDVGVALAALGFTVEDGVARTATYEAATPFLAPALARLADRLPEMIEQYLGRQSIPWEDTLTRVVSRLAGTGVRWAVIGSAALAARGVTLVPGDVDLVTDLDGAKRLAEIYCDELVLPPIEWTGAGLFGRAFDGMRVEWLGNDGSSWTGWTLDAAKETVEWQGHPLNVPPVDVQLAVEDLRGRADRAAAIRAFLGRGDGT